jgi:DMSO/TMAO reductase YedYZ molybdopterin-dependent catalytic subunit
LLRRARPKPEARFAVIHAEQGFTTNLPLAEMLADDVLFADRHDGIELTPEHGWPLRLVVPRRYFWKSAKWVRSIDLVSEDRPGFWERNGYHNDADPWREERFSDW